MSKRNEAKVHGPTDLYFGYYIIHVSTINHDTFKVVFNLETRLGDTPNQIILGSGPLFPHRSINNLKHCESIYFKKLNKEYSHIKN